MAHPIEGLVQIDDGSRWMRMTDPVHIVLARRPADVVPSIQEVQALVRARGCHALGFLRYEAGEAFGLEVTTGHHALPLVWFALFDAAKVQIVEPPRASQSYEIGPLEPTLGPDAFLDGFRKIRRHIADGDTYQVNYTFRLRGDFRGDAASLFADLAATQQGRYAAFIRFGRHAICSASPELFFLRDMVRLKPGTTIEDTVRPKPDTAIERDPTTVTTAAATITAKPMKGTARRGRTVAEDRAQSDRLLQSAKERAENVMIVDMMRNDLGRIAVFGSVDVPELFTLERYPNVWQMTSTVTARTVAPLDEIVAALFPCASVTGAPKVRTMQLIAALEQEPRGVYTGSVAYLAPDGRAQFNVAIRTAVIDLETGALEFGVGSGVVWDSDPEQEYEECLLKGSVLGRRPRPFELLETMRWTPREGLYLLERHLARLEESACYFRFACPVGEIRNALDRAVQSAHDPLRVRLLLAEDGAIRVECAPLDRGDGVLRVRLALQPVDPSDVFLFHKTTNRVVYERARRSDCDDVILWNPAREVTEATIANLVVEIDGRLVTPPIACGLLPGTFRAELLATGEVVEAPVTLERLSGATRLWLVNSVRGWCPAVLVK